MIYCILALTDLPNLCQCVGLSYLDLATVQRQWSTFLQVNKKLLDFLELAFVTSISSYDEAIPLSLDF